MSTSAVAAQTAGTRRTCADDAILFDDDINGLMAVQERHDEGENRPTRSDEDEETEEEQVEEEEEEEQVEEEEEEEESKLEEECSLEPSSAEDPKVGFEKQTFLIQGRKYTTSALIKNAGFVIARERLCKDPKATLNVCSNLNVHNIMECRHLHLSNRAVLIGDCYVKINMLVDNPARVALLNDPIVATQSTLCPSAVASDGHDAATCSALHLLPGIVFVGGPHLKVGYFEAELHDNLALRRLKESVDACGRWCTSRRSHVITTCGFVHYKWDNAYKETPRMPSKPIALIPSLQRRAPRPTGDQVGGGDASRCRGRGGRGCGNSGGGRGRRNGDDRGSCGGGTQSSQSHATPPLAAVSLFCDVVAGRKNTPAVDMDAVFSERKLLTQRERFLNMMLLLLGIIVATLAYMLLS